MAFEPNSLCYSAQSHYQRLTGLGHKVDQTKMYIWQREDCLNVEFKA